MAEALAAAHAAGVWHRDVKPGNVLVRRRDGGRWEVKVIDFGLAVSRAAVTKTLGDPAAARHTLLGGSVAGSLDYASPEQMGKLPGAAVGPASDVYGYGRTLCYALFGTPHPTARDYRRLPEALSDLLSDCTQEQPGERLGGFAAVLDRLGPPAAAASRPPPPAAAATPAAPEAAAAAKSGPPLPLRVRRDRLVRAVSGALGGWNAPGNTAFGLGLAFSIAAAVFLGATILAANGSGGGAPLFGLVLLPCFVVAITSWISFATTRQAVHLALAEEIAATLKEVPGLAEGLGSVVDRRDAVAGLEILQRLDEAVTDRTVEVQLTAPQAVLGPHLHGVAHLSIDGGRVEVFTGQELNLSLKLAPGCHLATAHWTVSGNTCNLGVFECPRAGVYHVELNFMQSRIKHVLRKS
jgi:hypothetical protein